MRLIFLSILFFAFSLLSAQIDTCYYCSGDDVGLFGNSSGGVGAITYSWICTDQTNYNVQNPSFTVSDNIRCSMVAIDEVGCEFYDTVQILVTDDPLFPITIDNCEIDFIQLNNNQNCTFSLDSNDGSGWATIGVIDQAITLPYSVNTTNVDYRVTATCDCDTYFSNTVTGNCGFQCSETPGATCFYDGTSLTLNLDATAYTVITDTLEWRKVDPSDNSIVYSDWELYTGPLSDCDIKETMTVNWKELNDCNYSNGYGGYTNLGFYSLDDCDDDFADVDYTFNGNNITRTHVGSINNSEPEASFINNGDKTFTVYQTTNLGVISESGAYSYSGDNNPNNGGSCNDLSWAVTSPANELYYTIEWRRTIVSQECGTTVFNGYCLLDDCSTRSVSATCNSTEITATATGCTGAVIYRFYKSGQLLQSGSSNTFTNPTSGSYLVEAICDGCTVQDNVSCSVSCDADIDISLNGTCELIISNVTNCSGYTIEWYKDFNVIIGETGNTLSLDENGTYWAQVTGCAGCNPVTSNSITVTGCSAACSPGITLFENNCNITASVSNCQGTPSYSWSTGATTQTIPATNDGTYSVTVTGCCQTMVNSISVNGCSENECENYSVHINPGSNQTLCDNSPQVLSFSSVKNNGNGGYSHEWRRNGSLVGTSSSYTFNTTGFAPGNYTIELRVTDSEGCFDNDFLTVTIIDCNDPCNMSVAIDQVHQTICEGVNYTFTATISNGTPPYNYIWRKNGNFVSSSSSYSTPHADGSSTISVEVTDANSCQDTDNTSLTVIDECNCGANSCDLTLELSGCVLSWGSCPGYTSTLQFNNGSGWQPVAGNPQGSYTSNISASYRLIWYKSGCSSFATNTETTSCTPNCNVSVQILPNYINMCEGEQANFSTNLAAGTHGDYTFNWELNGTTKSTSSTYNTVLPVGSNDIDLTITEISTGCTAFDTENILVEDFCTCGDDDCNILSESNCILTWPNCPGFNVFLNYKPSGGTYQPVFGASSPYMAENDGDYNLSITRSGCINQVSNAVTVSGCEVSCNMSLDPLPSVDLCYFTEHRFYANVNNGTPPYDYEWKVNGSLVGTGSTYDFKRFDGNYTVILEVEDVNGCTATTSTTVEVFEDYLILFTYDGQSNYNVLPTNTCEDDVIPYATSNNSITSYTISSPSNSFQTIYNAPINGTLDLSGIAPGEETFIRFQDNNGCVKDFDFSKCCQCDIAYNCNCANGACNVVFSNGAGGFDQDEIFEYVVNESGQLLIEVEPLRQAQIVKVYKNNVLMANSGEIVAQNSDAACGNDVLVNGIDCPPGGVITELNCYSLNQSIPADYLRSGVTSFKSYEDCLGPISSCTPNPNDSDRVGYQFTVSSGDKIKIDINHPACTSASNWRVFSTCNP